MPNPDFSFSSNTVEHYTPQYIVDAATVALGWVIDLDPASNEVANRVVKARRYFTKADDGYTQDWNATTVFCNPPYGKVKNQSSAGLWLQKMIYEYDEGHFQYGIMLLNAAVSSPWFQPAFRFPICFTSNRIAYLNAELEPMTQPTKDNALVYFGKDVNRFALAFDGIGTVVVRYG